MGTPLHPLDMGPPVTQEPRRQGWPQDTPRVPRPPRHLQPQAPGGKQTRRAGQTPHPAPLGSPSQVAGRPRQYGGCQHTSACCHPYKSPHRGPAPPRPPQRRGPSRAPTQGEVRSGAGREQRVLGAGCGVPWAPRSIVRCRRGGWHGGVRECQDALGSLGVGRGQVGGMEVGAPHKGCCARDVCCGTGTWERPHEGTGLERGDRHPGVPGRGDLPAPSTHFSVSPGSCSPSPSSSS